MVKSEKDVIEYDLHANWHCNHPSNFGAETLIALST